MSTLPLSRPLAAAAVPSDGIDVEVVATNDECAALAAFNETVSVDSFVARLHVSPLGRDGLRVRGTLAAEATRTCVVTLDPFPERISEDIDVRFVPGADAADERDDAPEPLVGGAIDLGQLAAEFFALALDPHPRKPGAVFAQDGDGVGDSPFAALRRLKEGPDGR
ncbi:MAG TPA: DUF177 domain-containing protein [Hansschlegelia sp.]